MSILTTIKKAPVSFDRFPVGAVIQEPRGRRMRYIKTMMNDKTIRKPFEPTLKGTYTNKDVDDDYDT